MKIKKSRFSKLSNVDICRELNEVENLEEHFDKKQTYFCLINLTLKMIEFELFFFKPYP